MKVVEYWIIFQWHENQLIWSSASKVRIKKLKIYIDDSKYAFVQNIEFGLDFEGVKSRVKRQVIYEIVNNRITFPMRLESTHMGLYIKSYYRIIEGMSWWLQIRVWTSVDFWTWFWTSWRWNLKESNIRKF